jgi:O-antigen/teichoic acid export membrane protein
VLDRENDDLSLSAGDQAQSTAPEAGESMLASSAYAFAAQLATSLFTAALTLYLVRALGPSQYGAFALAIGIGSLVALPADFGISSSTARFVAEHRDRPKRVAALLADAVRLKLLAATFACGSLAALAGPIAAAYHAPLTWPLRAVALAVFGQNLMFLFEGAFVASRQVAANVRMIFAESAVEFSASIVLVLVVGGAAGAASGRAIGYCIGGAFAMLLGARVFAWPSAFRLRGRISSGKPIARYAIPLMLVDGANTVFSMIDLLLIGAYLGSVQVGLFSAPLRLLTLLSYPGAAVASGVAPRMARGSGREPNAAALAGALRGLIIFQSLLLAPLIVWARPIVHILLGSGYGGSTATLRILSISAYLAGFAPLLSLSANYLGDARRRIPLMVGAALLDAAIDVVLIPRIGIVSGAIATAAALALMVGGHIQICRRHVALPLGLLGVSAVRALLAAAAMAGVLFAVGTNPAIPLLLAGGAAGIVAFVLTLLLVGEVTAADLASAGRQVGARIPGR